MRDIACITVIACFALSAPAVAQTHQRERQNQQRTQSQQRAAPQQDQQAFNNQRQVYDSQTRRSRANAFDPIYDPLPRLDVSGLPTESPRERLADQYLTYEPAPEQFFEPRQQHQPNYMRLERWSDGDPYFETGDGLQQYEPYHRAERAYDRVDWPQRFWTETEYRPGAGYVFEDGEYLRSAQPASRMIRGQVLGLEQLHPSFGSPATVRLRFRDAATGRVRIIHLGEPEIIQRILPDLEPGQQISIRGNYVTADGQRVLKAQDIRTPGGEFVIPDYETLTTVKGTLQGIRRVRSVDGEPAAVVAIMRTEDGRNVEVLLGEPQRLQQRGINIRPGDQVNVWGYTRSSNGQRTFVVQDVDIARRPLYRQQR